MSKNNGKLNRPKDMTIPCGDPDCTKGNLCKKCEYILALERTRKPLPTLSEKDKEAFLYIALLTLENLTKKNALIGIKHEGLETFPDCDRPVFAWNITEQKWYVSLPKVDKKIVTPEKRIIR